MDKKLIFKAWDIVKRARATPRANLNLFRAGVYCLSPFKSLKVRHYPVSYTIYVTTKCNYVCTFCYLTNQVKKSTELNYDDFNKIINHPFNRYAHRVTLGGGEPFLHKDLFVFIQKLKAMNKYVSVYTNGSLLRDRMDQLADVLIDSLHISHYDDKYGSIRPSIQRILKDNKSVKRICLSKIMTSDNIYCMESIIELALQDNIHALTFNNYYPRTPGEISIPIGPKNKAYLSEVFRLKSKYKNAPIQISFAIPVNPECSFYCNNISLNIIYDTDGNIAPCCFIVPPKEKFGRLYSNKDVWNSESIIELRKGNDNHCKYCYYRGGLGDRLYSF